MGWNVCKIGKVSQIFLQTGICVVEKSDFMKQIDFLRKLRSLKINCKGGELVKYEER